MEAHQFECMLREIKPIKQHPGELYRHATQRNLPDEVNEVSLKARWEQPR